VTTRTRDAALLVLLAAFVIAAAVFCAWSWWYGLGE